MQSDFLGQLANQEVLIRKEVWGAFLHVEELLELHDSRVEGAVLGVEASAKLVGDELCLEGLTEERRARLLAEVPAAGVDLRVIVEV